jgi:hypothetical protein
MMVFLAAGILYLLGVALVLYLKPEYMFTPDGQWKEFGIGQNPERYTAFPFWLFCISWALVSYGIALLLPLTETQGKGKAFNKNINVSSIYQEKGADTNSRTNQSVLKEVFGDDLVGETDFVEKKLKKGIYVLNKRASKLAGVPKYVYIGDDE